MRLKSYNKIRKVPAGEGREGKLIKALNRLISDYFMSRG